MNGEQAVEQHTVTVSAIQWWLASVAHKGFSTAIYGLLALTVTRYVCAYLGLMDAMVEDGIAWAIRLIVACFASVFLINCGLRAKRWRRARLVARDVEIGRARVRWFGHWLDLDWAREMGRRRECDGDKAIYSNWNAFYPKGITLLATAILIVFAYAILVRTGISADTIPPLMILMLAGISTLSDSLLSAYVQLDGPTLELSAVRQYGGEYSPKQVIPLDSASVCIWAIAPTLMTFSWEADGRSYQAALKNMSIEYCYYVFCAAIPQAD